jgi:nucleotide-binding universal stress UspA family protein
MPADLIIGFTGSPAGRDAVALGRRLALAGGARPTVVHVRPPRPPSVEVTELPDAWSWGASVAATLDEARGLLADVPGARFRVVAETSVSRVLHRLAAEAEAPLIVLGATHRSGLGRVIPGTTADAVIHAAPCAVAIAPAGYATRPEVRPFGLVAAAVDGGAETDRVARAAARIASRACADVRLITVADGPYGDLPLYAGSMGYAMIGALVRESSSATIERAAAVATDEASVLVERCVAEGDVAAEIGRRTDGTDLLLIGSRGRGPVRRAVLRDVAGRIVRAATCPVLVLPRRTPEDADEAVVLLAAAAVRTAPVDREEVVHG